jgi:hypothetical protein
MAPWLLGCIRTCMTGVTPKKFLDGLWRFSAKSGWATTKDAKQAKSEDHVAAKHKKREAPSAPFRAFRVFRSYITWFTFWLSLRLARDYRERLRDQAEEAVLLGLGEFAEHGADGPHEFPPVLFEENPALLGQLDQD